MKYINAKAINISERGGTTTLYLVESSKVDETKFVT